MEILSMKTFFLDVLGFNNLVSEPYIFIFQEVLWPEMHLDSHCRANWSSHPLIILGIFPCWAWVILSCQDSYFVLSWDTMLTKELRYLFICLSKLLENWSFNFFRISHGLRTPNEGRNQRYLYENLGWCGRQNMFRSYLKIWEWEWIFGRAVKSIMVRKICLHTGTDYGRPERK